MLLPLPGTQRPEADAIISGDWGRSHSPPPPLLQLQSLEELNSLWRRGLTEERQKLQPWHERPKLHMLQHLVEDQLDRWGSPIFSWCYRDEDFIGESKQVAERSKHKTLEANVMEKTSLSSGVALHRVREAERLQQQAHAPHAPSRASAE